MKSYALGMCVCVKIWRKKENSPPKETTILCINKKKKKKKNRKSQIYLHSKTNRKVLIIRNEISKLFEKFHELSELNSIEHKIRIPIEIINWPNRKFWYLVLDWTTYIEQLPVSRGW